MPQGQDLEPVHPDAVVHPVTDPIEVKPPYAGRTGFLHYGTGFRLIEQNVENHLEVVSDSIGSGRAIQRPPLDDALDVPGGSARYAQFERHFYR